jgi:hypothetical protein
VTPRPVCDFAFPAHPPSTLLLCGALGLQAELKAAITALEADKAAAATQATLVEVGGTACVRVCGGRHELQRSSLCIQLSRRLLVTAECWLRVVWCGVVWCGVVWCAPCCGGQELRASIAGLEADRSKAAAEAAAAQVCVGL